MHLYLSTKVDTKKVFLSNPWFTHFCKFSKVKLHVFVKTTVKKEIIEGFLGQKSSVLGNNLL